MELIIEIEHCLDCDVIEVVYKNDDLHDCDDIPIPCHCSMELRGKVYHGLLTRDFSVSDERAFLGDFCFPEDVEIRNVYLLVGYKAIEILCLGAEISCC